MTKTQYSYYLGLYDLDIIDNIDKNGVNIYKKVEWRKSGNQEYFCIIRKKLEERNNWYALNDKQVLHTSLIDFCFSNWVKLQTNSVVHNRILLDNCHFISNKSHYYDTFKEYEFIPSFLNISITNLQTIPDKITEKVILKPSTGSLSIGIKILDDKNTKIDIINHFGRYKDYTHWTLSPLYIAKRWTDGCILSNRIYYLVRKFKINNKLIITGYWFDEFIHYKASLKYNPNETDYKNIQKQIITNCSNNEITSSEFFDKRVLTHEKYLTLFTKNEYNTIKEKITDYLTIITNKISKHIICSNDYLDNFNDNTGENKNMSFHLYGIDTLIMDDLTIKILEINGAPSILYESAINHIDYSVIIDEILKLTVDVLYPPNNNTTSNTNTNTNTNIGPKFGYFKDSTCKVQLFERKFVTCGEFIKELKIPIYISREVVEAYPFIGKALFNEKRNKIYQRIKNPHSNNIFLFYGLRDRYIHNKSSLRFYDELIEYRISNNCRNAKIINKIQGITYFLASKDRLYNNCKNNDYIPESIIFDIDGDNPEMLNAFIESHNDIRVIIKPVYGSQGKGIVIMPPNSNAYMFINNMKWIKNQFKYTIFIISIYIDNPKLYSDAKKLKCNIKFNLRFYALLHINKLACYENNSNDINYYILKDVQTYFTVLPYNINFNEIATIIMTILNLKNIDNYIEIYDKIKKLSLDDISNLINLTNLQIVKNLSSYLNIPIDLNNFVTTLEDMNYDKHFKNNIIQQGENIITNTLQSIKYNIRNLNRFVPDSCAFNLIAYDTMVDDNDKLHLIEINRGPDLHGLLRTLGESKLTDIFGELFNIVIENNIENNLKYFQKYKLEY
jgi:hypothetical protein